MLIKKAAIDNTKVFWTEKEGNGRTGKSNCKTILKEKMQ